MKISEFSPLPLVTPGSGEKSASRSNTFGDLLQKKLQEVTELQKQADDLTEQFLAGKGVDLHQVLLATEKASLALQFTIQIRNKVLEAYQEISRMQV